MALQGYSTYASRNLIRAAQDMLAHAQPITVLGDFGTQREMPQNSTDTLVFRRTLPFGSTAAGTTIENTARYVGTPNVTPSSLALGEGATPNANTISFQDVTVTLIQYGLLFKFSSKVELLYEDDIPGEMVKLTGETMAECLELIRYGVLKAGSTVIYGNGSSRASINTVISLNALRKAARTLEANRAKRVTQRLAPGVDFGTRAVSPAFIVFIHTDAVSDVRNLPGFTKVEEYGTFKPIHDMEIGSCEDFRFIKSPLLSSFAASGSATLNGCLSIGGSNVDVYPFIVIGEDAWGQVALKGFNAIKPTILKSQDINHANPLGQFGFVGASTWFAAVRLNEAWMARIEVGVTAL
ncbi:MAG: N4-gp56 family major capsid protein [Burkholderiales bacterium]|nr:N4-gp56 family major capsid protein [Burkholderiales bacterium]